MSNQYKREGRSSPLLRDLHPYLSLTKDQYLACQAYLTSKPPALKHILDGLLHLQGRKLSLAEVE